MELYINTASKEKVMVSLEKEGKTIHFLEGFNKYGSQILLPLIEKLLQESGVAKKDLQGIRVASGPGSYTGIRVGVSVANALGLALGIPVNGKEMETDLKYTQ